MATRTHAVIVGAGQAGLALSRRLTDAGIDHVVLERGRIAERWHTACWDSLTLLTPNWLNRLPGADEHPDPDGFITGAAFREDLSAYARSFGAPLHEHHDVRAIERGTDGYTVEAGDSRWSARHVVIATGECDIPFAPPGLVAAAPPALAQVHAADYRNPAALPDGRVLVVGGGPSALQIALELRRADREVVVAAGTHGRMVRRYRGRDAFAWMAELGRLTQPVDDVDPEAERRAPYPGLTGAHGGEEIDLRVVQDAGVVVAGRLTSIDEHHAHFAGDLDETTARADANLRQFLTEVDAHLGGPGEHHVPPVDPTRAPSAIPTRDLGAIVWATGYRRAFPWLKVPVLDGRGEIVHDHGTTASPGLHVLGYRFQQRRASHFIGGVGVDAADIAARITTP